MYKSQLVKIPPKALALLWALATQAGHVVTKEELLSTVWTDTAVGEDTLTTFIGILRRALKDDARQPRYIATVHRVGFRFVASLRSSLPVLGPQLSVVGQGKAARTPSQLATGNCRLTTSFVGREGELTQLHHLFTKAVHGERQVVFVTGEAGIGKTALLETFVQELTLSVRRQDDARQDAQRSKHGATRTASSAAPGSGVQALGLAWGQGVEQYGAGEAYLPVLDALGRLGRGPQRHRVLTVLQHYAPTWLVHLPVLVSPKQRQAAQRRAHGATRERMLREITEALDALSVDQPVALVLEDLHWSDPSTVELLTALARRREPARLLVVGTYRATELAVSSPLLKAAMQELLARGQAAELALPLLSPAAVQAYVHQRVTRTGRTERLAEVVYRRTEGQPLFMVQMTDYLIQRFGTTAHELTDLTGIEQSVPHGLRAVIEAQLGRLTDDEYNVLAVGSISGAEFTAASVAVGLDQSEATIEALCECLARRRQFIAERGVKSWPDGTVSGSYGFRHALYQEVLYARVSEARRVWLHQVIAERLERGYGERAREIAAELVIHFERGHDHTRAVAYRYLAGQNAKERSAYAEAFSHVTAGLSLLKSLPDSVEHRQNELHLQMALATILQMTKGAAAAESANAYRQALALAQRNGATELAFVALFGLWLHAWMRGALPLARQQGEHLLARAYKEHSSLPDFVAAAHRALGGTLYFLGELAHARPHFEHALALAKSDQENFSVFFSIPAFGGLALAYLSCTLWLLGYAEQARAHMQEAAAQAHAAGVAYDMAATSAWSLMLQQFLQNTQMVDAQSEQLLQLAATQGFARWTAVAQIFQGWARGGDGGPNAAMDAMLQALAAFQGGGARLHLPYFLGLVAEVHRKHGNWEEGLRVVAKAFVVVEESEQRLYEAELWRLKGELTLHQKSTEPKAGNKNSQELEVMSAEQSPETLIAQARLSDPAAEAEVCFHQAIDVARQQQAKSLELRAVMSLARLRQQQVTESVVGTTLHPRRAALAEAHNMLAEVFGWFTEGFDTKDLQEAKALLASLASSVSTEPQNQGSTFQALVPIESLK